MNMRTACARSVLATLLWAHAASAQSPPSKPARPPPPAASKEGPRPEPPAPAGVSLESAGDKEKQQASAAYKAGKAAYDKNHFDEALAKFRESYGMVASPNARLMISRTLDKLQRSPEAYREARSAFLEADAATLVNPKYQQTMTDAQADIELLMKKIGFVTVTIAGAADAKLTVDGSAIAKVAWSEPIPVNPGKIEVVLTTRRGVVRRRIDVAAGANVAVSLAAPARVAGLAVEEAPEPAPPASPPSSIPYRKIIGYGSLGLGAAGMAMFAGFGAAAKSQASKLDATCPSRAGCSPEAIDIAKRGKSYQTAANVSVSVGAVALAAGVGVIVWDVVDARAKSKVRQRLQVRPTLDGIEVALSGAF